jgi:hypothetical protein
VYNRFLKSYSMAGCLHVFSELKTVDKAHDPFQLQGFVSI